MHLGENIRYLRTIKNMSQRDLADALDYKSYTTITKWESGTSEPPLNMVNKISELFNITVNDLYYQRLAPQEGVTEKNDTTAKRIAKGLEIRNMTPTELAERTGIGKVSIHNYLVGSYEPTPRKIYLIAKALNVSESWLYGYDVPMERTDTAKQTEISINDNISASEMQLIEKYRALDLRGKSHVDSILQWELEHMEALKTSPAAIINSTGDN